MGIASSIILIVVFIAAIMLIMYLEFSISKLKDQLTEKERELAKTRSTLRFQSDLLDKAEKERVERNQELSRLKRRGIVGKLKKMLGK